MNLPDLKTECHKAIDGLNGTPLSVFQILLSETGHQSVMIGGVPEIIVRSLVNAMKENHQIRELVEAAVFQVMDVSDKDLFGKLGLS